MSVPDVPTDFLLNSGYKQISVSFTPPSNDGGASIEDYYYSINGGTLHPTNNLNPFIVSAIDNGSNLIAGQTYTIQLKARNAYGDSSVLTSTILLSKWSELNRYGLTPFRMSFYNNQFYVPCLNAGCIDILDMNGAVVHLGWCSITRPTACLYNDGFLYVYSQQSNPAIYKINIDGNTPTPTLMVSSVDGIPFGEQGKMVIVDGYMYYTDPGVRIVKISLTPDSYGIYESSTFYNSSGWQLEYYNGCLYFIVAGKSKLQKLDIAANSCDDYGPDIPYINNISGLSIDAINKKIYYETYNPYTIFTIDLVNITSTSIPDTFVDLNSVFSFGLFIHDNYIYTTAYSEGIIYRYLLPYPSSPKINSITDKDSKLTVNFNQPADYDDIYYSLNGQAYQVMDSTSFHASSNGSFNYDIIGLINGQSYSVTLKSHNVSGFSELSNIVSGTPQIIISNTCFLANTPIRLDQGSIEINKINPKLHTIRNKKIVAITESVSPDKYLVSFKANSLGPNIPSQETTMSCLHQVFYKGKMIQAKDFLGFLDGIDKIEYNGEPLYNILLEEHEKMIVNNLIVETLHPSNKIAKLYNFFIDRNIACESRTEYIEEYNKQIQNNDIFGDKYRMSLD